MSTSLDGQIVLPTENTKKTIVLTGFYGRGNVGDEALLQCIYEQLKDLFDVHIVVDMHGASLEFQQWYPYCETSISHQTEEVIVHRLGRDGRLAGIIIGGGGLHLGFSANLAIAAASQGAPVFMIGVDFSFKKRLNIHNDNYINFQKRYRKLLSKFMVRSKRSFQNAREFGMEPEYGADLALQLITDNSGEWVPDSKRALIAIREIDSTLVGSDFFRKIQSLIGHLTVAGYEPAFLPCAPEDVRFLEQHSISLLAPTIGVWSNPRRLKELISLSGLLISIGRLHPIIFAAPTTTPVVGVAMPWLNGDRTIGKLKIMAEELGIEHFDSIAMLNLAISGSKKFRPADQEKVDEALQRLNNFYDDLRTLLLSAVRS